MNFKKTARNVGIVALFAGSAYVFKTCHDEHNKKERIEHDTKATQDQREKDLERNQQNFEKLKHQADSVAHLQSNQPQPQ